MQLLNNGEQGRKTYQEVVPWLEMAYFGGFLGQLEVSSSASDGRSALCSDIVVGMPSMVVETYGPYICDREAFCARAGGNSVLFQCHSVRKYEDRDRFSYISLPPLVFPRAILAVNTADGLVRSFMRSEKLNSAHEE